MLRQVQERLEKFARQRLPRADERVEESPVSPGVGGCEPGGRGFQRAVAGGGGAVIERVGEGDRRMNPLQPVALQPERLKEGRPGGERMDGRAAVVPDAGQRERFGGSAAADGALRLAQRDAPAGLREHDRGRQAVRAGADHRGGVSHGEESRAQFTGACFEH